MIKGRIVTIDGEPAGGVSVRLKMNGRMVIADANGIFVLQHLPALYDSLIISSVGSYQYRKKVLLKDGESLNIGTIQLTYHIEKLQTVEINGRLAHSYKSDYSFFDAKTETAVKDIPQSVSSITKELIHDKMEFTLKDVAENVAGVNQYSGYDEYTIRGFRAENPRDINGLRGYNTTYTSSMLVNIERIEVIKGPTATLYGNCDPGGTINLVTKKPLNHREGEINIFQGSWNHWRAEGDITGPFNKTKTLLYRFNAGYDQTHSFRNGIYAKSYQVAPSLTYDPNDNIQINFDFSLSHINTVLDRGQPGFKGDPDLSATPIKLDISQPGDYLKETDLASILTFSYKINKRLSFNLGYLNYRTRQDVAEHGLNSYISPDSVNLYYSAWHYQTATNTLTNYFTYQIRTGSIGHKVLLGYDYIESSVDLGRQYLELPGQFGAGSGIVGTFSLADPQYFQRPVKSYQPSVYQNNGSAVNANAYYTQAIYFQDEISFRKWKALFSMREEFYSAGHEDSAAGLSENVFLPRLGIVYALTQNLNLYSTYSKGFDPFESSAEAQQFTEPFRPVISELYEAGVKGNFFLNKLAASLAFYQLTVSNVAVNANDISNPNLFVQQGQNRSRGMEAEVAGNILPNLSVVLNYAYDKATVTQSKRPAEIGTTVPNAPRNSSASWIKYVFNKNTIRGFGISLGHSAVGVRNTLDPKITLPGYFLLNAGISYGVKKLSAALIVNNIGNETYWTSGYNNIYKWPGMQRNFMINGGYRF
ncbi:MAG: TonB-dependent receptor [Bacteroidota bacterium]|nr:TonB-dependent receptor [Bacteroidota bacterium]